MNLLVVKKVRPALRPSTIESRLTICRCVEDDETRIDLGCVLAFLPSDSVGVAPQPVVCLVQVDIVVGSLQRPERADARTSAAYDGYLLTSSSSSRLAPGP